MRNFSSLYSEGIVWRDKLKQPTARLSSTQGQKLGSTSQKSLAGDCQIKGKKRLFL
jgi:hypothetical protein